MNVYPFLFDFPRKKMDAYGFFASKVVDTYYTDIEALLHDLRRIQKRKPDIRYRAQPYSHTVNTPYRRQINRNCYRNSRFDSERSKPP